MSNSNFHLTKSMIRGIIHELRTGVTSLVGFLYLEKGPQEFIQSGKDILTRLNAIQTKVNEPTEASQLEALIQESGNALNKIAIDMYTLAQTVSKTESYSKSKDVQYAVELIFQLIDVTKIKDFLMTTTDINVLLDQMVKQDAWDCDIGPVPTLRQKRKIANLIEDTPMPDDLKTFLARTMGGKLSIGNIYILDYESLGDIHHNQPYMFINVPDAIYFAQDNGGGYFFMDTTNTLGRGTGAIFFGRKGALYNADNYVFCGQSLAEFLRAILNGKEVWEGPTLEQTAINTMLKAIIAAPQHFTGNSGADLNDLYAIVDRYDMGRMPTVLETLLRYRNGLIFTKPEITIWDSYTIKPTEGAVSKDGSSCAISIGEDERGRHYILTLIGTKGDLTNWPLLAGRVMRLKQNQPLNKAEYLGYLPELVVQWLKDD